MSENLNTPVASASILDTLLGQDIPVVKDNLPRADYEVNRLSEIVGKPVVFRLQALSYGRTQEIKRMTNEAEIQILLAGCVEPDLKSAALREKFGGVTPAETVKAMLLPGEIEDLSLAIEQLSGYRRKTITEVKNA